ncbi:MAG: hypothetical protein QHH06_04600 [Clostridiales bacterium]|nr:hypothetical protein [Eubacteriales bacterium]MDH7565747.1 hypothetical protein [Clostridiales bacterium]
MDYTGFLKFFVSNSLFTFSIILIGFVLGWVLYNHVILRTIRLGEALFEKDNLAAWVEFIGAFIFPTLYLSAKAVEGSASTVLLLDLLICIGYAVVYIVLFTILRLFSDGIVRIISPSDHEGSINLNNEIYRQRNTAASLFSAALSIIFVSLIRFLDFMPEFFAASVLRAGNILIFTLAAFAVYTFVLRYRTTLMKEIFVDNNAAAGTALVGFIFAVEMILSNVVEMQKEFNFPELLLLSAISLGILGIFSFIFKAVFSKILGVDIWKEVYEQDSVGAAIGQCALYISIAGVVISFIK